jgi:hypothetical protein
LASEPAVATSCKAGGNHRFSLPMSNEQPPAGWTTDLCPWNFRWTTQQHHWRFRCVRRSCSAQWHSVCVPCDVPDCSWCADLQRHPDLVGHGLPCRTQA